MYSFIQAIANGATVPRAASKTPLFKIMLEVAKDFTLNDIEILAWAVVLENYIWPLLENDIVTQLQFSALAVKEMMNGDSGAMRASIANKSRSTTFIDDFEYWRATRFLKVSAKDINMKFRELTEACDATR